MKDYIGAQISTVSLRCFLTWVICSYLYLDRGRRCEDIQCISSWKLHREHSLLKVRSEAHDTQFTAMLKEQPLHSALIRKKNPSIKITAARLYNRLTPRLSQGAPFSKGQVLFPLCLLFLHKFAIFFFFFALLLDVRHFLFKYSKPLTEQGW